ncbi:MAG: HU family DNA-binding protein [Prevotellaceae bacterium]|jgi:predicted histone-like DNA-binding protein|nr:HU family DNA-binding protein [Prevotellaceae bacterium]
MSIYYRLDEQTDNLNSGESRKRGLFPRIIRKKTVGLETLCASVAEGTSFNAFEVETAAKMFVQGILRELSEGNNVCIDGFGTFSVSAEAVREAQEQHDIRAESIRLKKIVFKTSKALLKHSGFKFQRLPAK